jgi:hypothetical protein
LAEPECLFDLSEDRLGNHLATPVERPAGIGGHLLMHPPADFLR